MINALWLIITIGIIFGLALLFYTVVRVTPEESYVSAIMTIMLLIYITGFCGSARIALYIIYVMAAIGLLLSVIAVFRKLDNSLITFLTPSIVMVTIVACVGIIAFKGFVITNWDELYQWAKAADYIMLNDKLPTGGDFSGEAALLSSTTFFHYFISKPSEMILGKITESNYYVSNLILWMSALVMPLSGLKWKDYKKVFLFFVFNFLMAAMIYVQPYYNIYTDQATAYWSGCLIAWVLLRKNTKRNLYIIPMILINVGFMKSMEGPLFALIALFAIIILAGVNRKEKGMSLISSAWKKNVFSLKGLSVILGIISPFILVGVWSAKIGQQGFWRFGNAGLEGEEDKAVLTIKAMVRWLFKSVTLHEDRFFLSYALFIVITIAVVNLLHPVVVNDRDKYRFRILMRIYIIGFVLFFMIMYVAFITVFEYQQSVQAVSLNRYFSDYMMLGIVPITIPFFVTDKGNIRYVRLINDSLIFVFMVFVVYGAGDYFLNNFAHAFAVDTDQYYMREQLTEYSEKVKALTEGKGKIYFINQKRSGLFTLAADYEMGDQISRNGMCFQFREDTSEKIAGLTDYPVETLPQVLDEQGYDYLWVYSNNNYFTKSMKSIFGKSKVKNGYFYKVVHTDDGIDLEYIERIK